MTEFAPLIYVDLIKVKPRSKRDDEPRDEYGRYIDSFQPWRWVAKSADNQKKLARSTERYFNKTDALHAIDLLFGRVSNVYLRQVEFGNQVLRMATDQVPF